MKKPKHLAKQRYSANRIWILLLLVSLLVTMFDFSAFSSEETTTEYSNTLDEWSVQALWSNNSSVDMVYNSTKSETIPFTLTFTYFLNGASRDYKENEIKFKIKGIGDINRGEKLVAETTTTEEDSSWALAYDDANDEYTFTYKNAVPKRQIMSGGFQMQWKVNSRQAVNGYTYTSSPVFSITDGTDTKSINLKPLTIKYTSERDWYNIDLHPERLTGLEHEKVDGSYIWYDYVTTVGTDVHARGIYKSDYFVEIIMPEGTSYDQVKAATTSNTPIDIVEIQDPATGQTVHGFYRFRDKYGAVADGDCEFRLGFDSALEGKAVTVNTRLVPLFYDESRKITESTDGDKFDATHSWSIVNYDFTYASYDYSQVKSIADSNSTILVNEIYGEKTIKFRIHAQTDRHYNSSGASAYTSPNPPTQYQTFDFIQGDDYLIVQKNSGHVRRLEESEYDFAYVAVPSDKHGYDYDVYTSTTHDLPFDEYTLYASGNTSTAQTVRFGEGVKSFYVKVKGVCGSYGADIYTAVNFHFDWGSEQKKEYSEQINPNGIMANFSLLRLVKTDNGVSTNFAATDGENYVGVGTDELKERDWNLYDEYLYREVISVKLRSAATTINSTTGLDKLKKDDIGNYNSTVTSAGTIQSDLDGKLKKFSVYTVLQKGLSVNEVLDGITVSGSAEGINGEMISDSMFNENVSYELKTDSTGRQIVVSNFDFSDTPIESSEETKVTVNFPVSVTKATYAATGVKVYSAETYVMVHDEGILKFLGNNLALDVYDLDGDGNKNEYTAKSTANKTIGTSITEWKDSAEKYVKTATTKSYVHGQPYENVRVDSYSANPALDNSRACYSYRLDLSIGDNAIKDIIVFDNIEPSSKTVELSGGNVSVESKWHGLLKSVDTSQPDSLGIISTVYYSESETQAYTLDINDPSANGWKIMNQNGSIWTAPDDKEVRTIAVKYDTTNLSDGGFDGAVKDRLMYSVVNMQAPEITESNMDIVNTSTQNNFEVQYQVNTTEGFKPSRLLSAVTTVSLDQAGPEFEIKKYDAENKAPLTGAKFSIYSDEQCTKPVSGLADISVNNLGRFVGKLPIFGTYYIKETQAPTGYKLRTDVIELKAESSYTTVEIANERITGTLNFKKKDADNNDIDNLEGAEYQIYTVDGTAVFTDENNVYSKNGTKDTFVTDANGFTVTGLPWGDYYLLEIKAPNGYEMNSRKVKFSVSKNGTVTDDAITVDASQSDNERTATLMLTKTDETTGERLKNAWYKVQKKVGDDWVDTSFHYSSTNAYGELRIEGVKFGEYRFVEINAPGGYEINSDTITPKSVILDASTVGQTVEFTHSDRRKTGSIDLTKYTDTGAYLSNARFDLYMVDGERDGDSAPANDPADKLIRNNLVTDSNGKIPTVESLEWGKYYFVETFAPTGYKKSDATFSPEIVEITAENADITQEVEVTDKQIRGSVRLTKYGENPDTSSTEALKLQGAVFVLCNKDGKQIKVTDNGGGSYSYDETSDNIRITTDSNGEIAVDNIPWGAYYFEEIEAPNGYAVADKVRFTVNGNNCLSVQELECYDSLVKCQITVEKEIDEALSQFGDPTFIFKIKDNDSGQEWLRTIQLNNEKKSGSFTLSVTPGKYTVEEIKVSRYTLTGLDVIDVDNASTTTVTTDVNTKTATVEFQPTDTAAFAKVKFTNTLSNYDKFNHVVGVNNIVPVQRKITGISVVYNGGLIPIKENEEADNYTIPKEQLTAKFIYDDGSEEVITDMENLIPTDGGTDFTVDNGVNSASSEIELAAQYTKDGKTYKTKFYVTVEPLVVTPTQKVMYRVDTDNASYFDKNGKHVTANVVYYSDGQAVSGEYVPISPIGEKLFVCWEAEDGTLLYNHDEIIDYIKNHSDILDFTITAVLQSSVNEFAYTGTVQEFIAPCNGRYKLEVWGAYGGGDVTKDQVPGAGAYVTGVVNLKKDEKLYVYVGEHPTTPKGVWNGGGLNSNGTTYLNYPGGGATDIALNNAEWDSDAHLYSRILVAGGGGGFNDRSENNRVKFDAGGDGGSAANNWAGTNGVGNDYGYGGTLTAGGRTASGNLGRISNGLFGKGGSAFWVSEVLGGGGGGWYGGGAGGGANNNGSGGGGSSYAWSTEQGLNAHYPSSTYKPSEDYYLTNVDAVVRNDYSSTNGNGKAVITFIGN